MSDPTSRMAWFKLRFDLVGFVAAMAVLLVALLLGWLWAPLFWVGAFASLFVLFSAKWASRVSPEMPTGIVSPVDGVITSITETEPPIELRMGVARAKRIRISSGPLSSNKLHAPITGSVATLIIDQGLQTLPFAFSPDPDGLMDAYVTLESRGQEVGLRVATGGLGPRLEFAVEAGDMMRLGARVGTRRLGGWADLFVPLECQILVWEGQTLVAGETVLSRLTPLGEIDLADDASAENSADIETFLLSEMGEMAETTSKTQDAGDADETETDSSDVLARLRKLSADDTDT